MKINHHILAALSVGIIVAMAEAQPVNLGEIKIHQRLNELIPTGAEFQDAFGRTVTIDHCINGRPTLLMIGYYECPMLCEPMLADLPRTLDAVPYELGGDYNFIMMSISPDETPAVAKQRHDAFMDGLDDATDDAARSVHMLSGSPRSIREVTESTGYGYAYDANTGQYAHPAALIVLAPDGRISRYLLGMKFNPRDVKLALLDASRGEIGSTADGILLQCYQYDPTTGRYGLAVMTILRFAGVLTVVMLGGLIAFLSFRSRRRRLVQPQS